MHLPTVVPMMQPNDGFQPTHSTTSSAEQPLDRTLFDGRAVADGDALIGEARLAMDRAERLQRLAAALSASVEPKAVGHAILDVAVEAAQARAGGVLLYRNGRVEMLDAVGFDGEPLQPFAALPLPLPTAAGDAIDSGSPAYVGSIAEGRDTFPVIADAIARQGYQACAALPLVTNDETIGLLCFNYDDCRAFPAEERAFLETMALYAAQSLHRAMLFEAERTARENAERARADAERANRAKMDFLAVMSHELRTPLNAIDGHAELMELGVHGPLTDAQREALRRIRRSEAHLLGLINDVLNFAKLEAGSVSYEIEPVSIHAIVQDIVAVLAPRIESAGLAVDHTECASDIVAMADADKLGQIVLNLLSNAVKYASDGGSISIRCGIETADGLRVATLRVTDNGAGIPPDKIEAIFEPFVQLGRSFAAPRDGAGLGLAISRGLARAMGGDLKVTSKVGTGSEFTLLLPAPLVQGTPGASAPSA